MNCFLLLCLLLDISTGLFSDETMVLQVTEGDTVTLQTGVEKQKDDLIAWYFGPDNTLVAKINGKASSSKIHDTHFVGKVKLDRQTGSLNISDVTTTHSGLYNLRISSKNRVSYKKFKVTVYAVLPIPVIIRNASQHSSSSEGSSVSKCSLLCSVVNVSHVTLSWYKGNGLISSISVSELSINVSLPLEVEYEDKNTYSCVLNNTISSQSKHLDISQLCQPCARSVLVSLILAVLFAVVPSILVVVIVVICIRKRRGGYQKANLMRTVHADTSILKFNEKGPKIQEQV